MLDANEKLLRRTLITLIGIIVFLGAALVATQAEARVSKEDQITAEYCRGLNGRTEVRHYYLPKKYIKVDCETKTEVIEAGLDKRSSLDSVQQAVFFSIQTGKTPVVVLYDTDGKEGIYEYRIRSVCEKLGIEYRSIRIH